MKARPWRSVGVVGLVLLAVSGCGGGAADATDTVTVLAAASLTEGFTQIADAFEQANPGVRVMISFGPSSGLVSQVIEGAAADVLATANESTMAGAVDAGVVGVPRVFATNALAIAVPASNPAGITDIAGLAAPGVLVAVCEPQVPCGVAAEQVIAASGLAIEPVTYELDVKSVLSKVVLDEVDAGFVYATDIAAAGADVVEVAIPADAEVSVAYPIAVLAEPEQPEMAKAFVDFVLGEQGQGILAGLGFGSRP